MDYRDDRWSLSSLRASWSETYHQLGYELGDIDTIDGIATVYRQKPNGKHRPLTMIDFVFDGYRYRRTWDDILTRRTCVRRARRFAEEIVNQSCA